MAAERRAGDGNGDGRRRGRAVLPRVIVVMGVERMRQDSWSARRLPSARRALHRRRPPASAGQHRAHGEPACRSPMRIAGGGSTRSATRSRCAARRRGAGGGLLGTEARLSRPAAARRARTSLFIHLEIDKRHRRAEGGRAQGPFHAGEPDRQPVRRSQPPGPDERAVVVRCEASGRRTGGAGCCGLPSGPSI